MSNPNEPSMGGEFSPKTPIDDEVVEFNPQARNWAMFAHLSSLSTYVILPFGNIIGPLAIWLIKKDDFPFVDEHAKEALNFGISATIYGIIAGVLVCAWIGFVLLPVVLLFHIVFTIFATMAASAGKRYRYPLTLRLVN